MSSIGVVVFRNTPLNKQVLQESINNTVNINNNDVNQKIIIVRKKHKLQHASPPTVSVTSLVRAAEPVNSSVLAKKPRIKESSGDEGRAPTPLAVARRNARERNRVRQVNDGFAALRKHIPEEVAATFENINANRGPNKKLSKVETLRMAVEYIRNLETLLNIGHADKENGARTSMESFPSPASSSPRDNSQERSYFSINSPALEDEEEDDLDGTLQPLPQQHYVNISAPESFQLVSTPHLYEEDDVAGQPMTPSSDLLCQDDVSPHLLESHFPFPSSAEHFSVIPDQHYCNESEVPVCDSDFEIKYADSLQQQLHQEYSSTDMALESLDTNLIMSQDGFKYKEEDEKFNENEFNQTDLKKELPDIHVTPEDREQFEETLKWWQEKTRQVRPLSKSYKKD